MRTTRTGEWARIRAGDWVMSVWAGDDQVAYRAVRGRPDWTVRKSVAGAQQQTVVLGVPHKTLREAKAAVQADWEPGLL